MLPVGVPAESKSQGAKKPFPERAWFNRYGGAGDRSVSLIRSHLTNHVPRAIKATPASATASPTPRANPRRSL